MIGMNYAAQDLTIRLLQQHRKQDRQAVFIQALDRLDGNENAQDQLQLCMMMAGELEERPEKYDTFEALSKTILARQKKEKVNAPLDDTNDNADAVTKKEVGKAMKLANTNANKQLTRINDYERELRPSEIENLLSGFQRESNRIFWKNMIYYLFPDLHAPDDSADVSVQDCLRAVWDSLTPEEQDLARYTFLPDWAWFDQLTEDAPEEEEDEDDEEAEPEGLYDLLEKCMAPMARRFPKGIKSEVISRLGMDPDTYYSYRKKWIAYEQGGTLPLRRLSREQLFYLALFLEIDFWTTALLLAKAGYALRNRRADSLVAKFLLKNQGSREEIMTILISPKE